MAALCVIDGTLDGTTAEQIETAAKSHIAALLGHDNWEWLKRYYEPLVRDVATGTPLVWRLTYTVRELAGAPRGAR